MKNLITIFMSLLLTVPAGAVGVNFGVDGETTGSKVTMTGSGSAMIATSPTASDNVIKVTCSSYNSVPQREISLPDDLTLGSCLSVAYRVYIPSDGNEQYANYKQTQIYINGSLAYRDTDADGNNVYPSVGSKDHWNTVSVDLSSFDLTDAQRALQSFTIGIGLNDNKMTYYISEIIFEYEKAYEPPVLTDGEGAYTTGEYRNLFREAGYTDSQIQQRVNKLWSTYFEGNTSNERLYYESADDPDMAYFLDVNNNDVRTEGMSYGMMLCVQLDKKKQFDALWRWAKKYMQFPETDERRGYFAWNCKTDGTKIGTTPASDGEEYMVMALMFASHRWGDDEGELNYSREANYILDMSWEKPANSIRPFSSYTPLFDKTEKQVVFVPYASAAKFTDPSYHLPAFYELWARWADNNRSFYAEMAAKSREMFPKFAHPVTGLMPDYAEFDGSAHKGDGDHADFLYDAWRCITNMAMDYSWFKPENVPYTELVNRMLGFFASKGITKYYSNYTLDGNEKNGNKDHSAGLVGSNATGTLASDRSDAIKFVENFYNMSIPTGKYRYYDGCLYFLNWLHCAGMFRIYGPEDESGISDIIPATVNGKISLRIDDYTVTVDGAGSGSYSVTSLTSGITLSTGSFINGKIDLPSLSAGAYALTVNTINATPCTIKLLLN